MTGNVTADVLVKGASAQAASLGHDLAEWEPGIPDEWLAFCRKCGLAAVIYLHGKENVYGSTLVVACEGTSTAPWWEADRRYEGNRKAGNKDQAIALPFDSKTNDRLAAKAEHVFAARHGLFPTLHDGPDRGFDFEVGGKTIDVKWTPRQDGRLLHKINSRYQADFYVLITGMEMRERGWATGEALKSKVINLGHGPTFGLNQADLDPDVSGLLGRLLGAEEFEA